MRRTVWCGALLLAAIGGTVAAAKPRPDLTVHEWGTFLAMSGSDGMTLDGMYHEEHSLPRFVHARGKDRLRLPTAVLKGETPVIYFYTDRAQDVSVRVDFPSGIWTQWYPQASQVSPSLASAALPEPRQGHISWKVALQPAVSKEPAPALIPVSSDALWRFSREVDAAYVHPKGAAAGEWERFLFYRGLGQARLPLKLTEAGGGVLTLDPAAEGEKAPLVRDGIQHLFVLRVEGGKGAFRYLPRITAGQPLRRIIPARAELKDARTFSQEVGDSLVDRLVEAGLYPKEARAMVHTWSSSYFDTEGIRVLALMPQSWTDRFIPMRLEPQPASLVRVMVARLELLTGEREQQADRAVRNLSSEVAAQRDQAFNYLRDQGRYVEPVLRRVLLTSQDEQVQALCKRLVLTGFVTELRTATRSAASGRPQAEEVSDVQAQLAALLKEVGLEREARETAEPLLQRLRSRPEPSMDRSSSRGYFRAVARASEALGDDAQTARAYARFVQFGSRVKQCGGCHDLGGPSEMSWFRDWWAGRRFAQYAAKAGVLQNWIGEQEKTLAVRPGDTAAQMLLAYLYEAGGEADRAEALWNRVAPSQTVRRPEPGTPALTAK